MKTDVKRSTIYFDPDIHKTLKIKAASTHHTISEIVNGMVKQALSEDEEDLSAFDERAKEPDLDFEDVLRSLKKRGKI